MSKEEEGDSHHCHWRLRKKVQVASCIVLCALQNRQDDLRPLLAIDDILHHIGQQADVFFSI
jgi:hypothetical protein